MYQQKFVVIIPTYLRVECLEKCLLALEKQTQTPQEVIIVRRNTDHTTGNFLKNYAQKSLPFCVHELQVEQHGYLPPVKAGFAVATGDYVALIDDDVIVNQNWVETAIRTFEGNPKLGAISGAAICYNKNHGSVYPAKLYWAVRFASIRIKNKSNNKINALAEGNVIFRKEAIDDFCVDLRLNNGRLAYHGLDIGLQLIKKGWELRYESLLNAEHLALQRPSSAEITHITNLMIIIRKNLGMSALVKFVFYNLLVGQYFMPGLIYYLMKNNTSWKSVRVTQNILFTNVVSLR